MHVVMLFSLLFPVFVVTAALVFSAQPRRGIVLGVSLPLEVANGPEAQRALRRYKAAIGIVGLLLALLLIALSLHGSPNRAAPAGAGGILVLLLAAWALRAWLAAPLRAYRVRVPVVRSASLDPEESYASLVWAFAAFLPLAAAALYLHRHWSSLPARWPRHWDAAGHVDGWGTRSVGSAALPLVMGAFVVLVFLAILAMQRFAPGIDTSTRRSFCAPLALMTWLMSVAFASLALTPVVHFGAGAQLILIGAHAVAILGVVVWAVMRSGFMNASSSTTTATVAPHDGTSDDFWYGGLIYCNRNDAAVLVPKRFGWGWTLNFGRPLSWLFLGGVLAAGVFSVILPRILK